MPASVEPVLTVPFVLYQSARLSAYAEQLIHGFTGKPLTLGGAAGPPEAARANRLELCAQTGMDPHRLILPRQTHTDRFRVNDVACEDETDAVIVTEPGVACMVQVADCVPVILYEPVRHVGAVIHAGWRGTAQAITRKVCQALLRDDQAEAVRLIAVIGPSIGGCCYEVSPEVAQAVGASVPDQPTALWQAWQANGKPRINLQEVNRLQLESLGVQSVETITACTLCETEKLWSHRRGESGRQVAFLQLR